MRTLPPPDLTFAINDLCKRYSVDLADVSRSVAMDWDDLAKLAADPNVTIGSATVNYPVLSSLRDADAQREIDDGQGGGGGRLSPRHQAFRLSVRRPRRLAQAARGDGGGDGLRQRRVDTSGRGRTLGRTNLRALPRVAWDGRQRSLRMMRVMLSGVTFAPVAADAERIRFKRRAVTSS